MIKLVYYPESVANAMSVRRPPAAPVDEARGVFGVQSLKDALEESAEVARAYTAYNVLQKAEVGPRVTTKIQSRGAITKKTPEEYLRDAALRIETIQTWKRAFAQNQVPSDSEYGRLKAGVDDDAVDIDDDARRLPDPSNRYTQAMRQVHLAQREMNEYQELRHQRFSADRREEVARQQAEQAAERERQLIAAETRERERLAALQAAERRAAAQRAAQLAAAQAEEDAIRRANLERERQLRAERERQEAEANERERQRLLQLQLQQQEEAQRQAQAEARRLALVEQERVRRIEAERIAREQAEDERARSQEAERLRLVELRRQQEQETVYREDFVRERDVAYRALRLWSIPERWNTPRQNVQHAPIESDVEAAQDDIIPEMRVPYYTLVTIHEWIRDGVVQLREEWNSIKSQLAPEDWPRRKGLKGTVLMPQPIGSVTVSEIFQKSGALTFKFTFENVNGVKSFLISRGVSSVTGYLRSRRHLRLYLNQLYRTFNAAQKDAARTWARSNPESSNPSGAIERNALVEFSEDTV